MNELEFIYLRNLMENREGRLDSKFERNFLVDSEIEKSLEHRAMIFQGKPTKKALNEMEKYRVDNAIILAAGVATRFVPLSLEKPKGLYEVQGEKLIERQIKQLIEVGITDITVVLGYKKEMFFSLKNKYNVKFIFNDLYNVKNNIHSILVASKELSNTYICSSDDYFIDNPFNKYEYSSFYAGVYEDKKTNEMYVNVDDDFNIIEMSKGEDRGNILLGHSYWDKEFSRKFINIARADQEYGIYDNMFWEWLVKDNLSSLKMRFKEYDQNSIFEFDYFDQLRKFDKTYIENSNSKIMERIKLVFRCNEEDIVNFHSVSEGMTNTSFIFNVKGVDYIYRNPGEGTEQIINRKHEKESLEIANKLGIDPTYIYEDISKGWKISKLVRKFREPEYDSFEDSKKVISVLQNLHTSKVNVDYGMRPWEDALEMERLLKKQDPQSFNEFERLKHNVQKLYDMVKDDGVEKCFCHGDTYKHNWMITDKGTLLIDWEYSGMSDPGIDVGYYIVDAMYDFEDAKKFIREYLGDVNSSDKEKHFMCYVAIVAYYWFVWALYRESCGATMGESLYNWYSMATKYSNYMLDKFDYGGK